MESMNLLFEGQGSTGPRVATVQGSGEPRWSSPRAFARSCLSTSCEFQNEPKRAARAVRPLAASGPTRRPVKMRRRGAHVPHAKLLARSSSSEHTLGMKVQVFRAAIPEPMPDAVISKTNAPADFGRDALNARNWLM